MDYLRNEIKFAIMSLKDFGNKNLARSVFEAIAEAGNTFFPTVYDSCEPLRRKCSPNDIDALVRFWVNEEYAEETSRTHHYAMGSMVMERRRKPKSSYLIHWEKVQQERFNYLVFSMDLEYLKAPKHLKTFLALCTQLIVLLEPVQGEITNCAVSNWTDPIDLRVRHPELEWMNFFGRPYIDMFGREKLLSAPCHSVKEIGDNVIALQLSENPFQSIPSKVRNAVKDHLDPEAFVEEGKSYLRYKTGHIPQFDFSDILFDKASPPVPPQIRMRGTIE